MQQAARGYHGEVQIAVLNSGAQRLHLCNHCPHPLQLALQMPSILPTEGALLRSILQGALRLLNSLAARPTASLNICLVLCDLKMLRNSAWNNLPRHCAGRYGGMLPTSCCSMVVKPVLPEAERIRGCSEGAAAVAPQLHPV